MILERKVVYLHFFLGGKGVVGMPCYTGPHVEAPGSVRRQSKENVAGAFIVVSRGRNK